MKAIFLALLLPGTLCAEPAFVGVLGLQNHEFFALTAERDDRVQWCRIGDTIGGYTIVEYQPAFDRLIVRNQTGALALPLRRSAVKSSRLTEEEILAVATHEIARNESWASASRMQGPNFFEGNWIVVARHEDAGKLETRVIVIAPSGVLQSYSQL